MPSLLFIGLLASAGVAAAEKDYSAEREALIREIEQDVKATALHLGRERLDPRVLQALRGATTSWSSPTVTMRTRTVLCPSVMARPSPNPISSPS